MKIVSLNKNPEKYGYLSEMDLTDKSFHGHQTALAIGIKRPDGSWQDVYTSGDTLEEKTKIANDILSDKSLIILEDKITQLEDNKLVDKIIYYLPYYVADHSAYQPTINFDQISYSCNVRNKVKIEVLFVRDGCNRYVTFDMYTSGSWNGGVSLSLMDFMEDLETEIEDEASKPRKEEDKSFFVAEEDNFDYGYSEGDIVLDFYDKAGQKYLFGGNPEDFLKLVSSIRIIGLDTEIIKEDENTNEQSE